MIKKIGPHAAYVTGPKRSAIYVFSTGKVYSLDEAATNILSTYLTHPENSTDKLTIEQIEKICESRPLCNDDYIFETISPTLKFVWLELTQRCNCRCIHCYEGGCHSEVAAPLSFEDWKSIISDLRHNNCQHIRFIGGEPTVVPYLSELIEYSRNLGIPEVSLFSNLYYLPSKLVKSIIDNRISINFSIYASTEEIHDKITQTPGSFKKLIENISLLQSKGVPLRGNFVAMKENESEFPNTKKLLCDMGINSFHLDEIRKVWGGSQSKHMLSCPKIKYDKPNFRTSAQTFDIAGKYNTCWYGRFVISTDGEIYPCVFERTISYGNIKDISISELLSSDLLRKYWQFSFDQINPCKVCEYRFACHDCRPLAYAEKGCMHDQNPRCTYDPYTGVWGN